jgi:tetratricopeptide (TPR) repeat protein
MQKRNYCGPSTIDLLLRFWKSDEEFSDDQIADYVKLPHGGTPPYRMQEFFHLVGFDTVRCIASIEGLKRLIAAGYPVIVIEEFPDNSHVSVAIGYDEDEHLIEFQDPMTHQVITLPYETLNLLRRTYLDSAVVAFPHGKGHDVELARLGFFDEPSIVWTDRAELDMEKGQYQQATSLMERAVQRLPAHQLSWVMWLSAELEGWQRAVHKPHIPRFSLAADIGKDNLRSADVRKRYYTVLQRARELYPESKFVHVFAGHGALQDGEPRKALEAFKHAGEIDPGDSRNFAAMAECHFALREMDQALEAARQALKRNPTSPLTNVWMARCLAQRGDQTAEHYARCALELAPNWWLAHQAMAEVLITKRDGSGARRELELALAFDPEQPQARIQRAILASLDGYHAYAVLELEKVLKSRLSLPLYAEFNAHQTLCRLMFARRHFGAAKKQIQKLLKLLPEDPWALQFLAAVSSEIFLDKKSHRTARAGQQVHQLYAAAIRANKGKTWIVADYLNYLARFESPASAWERIVLLRVDYPDNKGLH